MRRGLESLESPKRASRRWDSPGFAAPFSVSCTDHNGHHAAYMQQWDGTKWGRSPTGYSP